MLRHLFDEHHSDKGYKHNYDIIYEADFMPLQNKKINLLEIGILGGSSLKSWLDYFPNANIYAIDILNKNSVPILSHSRINYLQHDSTDSKIINQIKNWNVQFDIIIDDGLHTPEANHKTFENLYNFLKNDGVYYIEDFFPIHLMNENDYNTKSGNWVKLQSKNWSKEAVNHFLYFISCYNYEIFDNRHLTTEQDSFVFKIKK